MKSIELKWCSQVWSVFVKCRKSAQANTRPLDWLYQLCYSMQDFTSHKPSVHTEQKSFFGLTISTMYIIYFHAPQIYNSYYVVIIMDSIKL